MNKIGTHNKHRRRGRTGGVFTIFVVVALMPLAGFRGALKAQIQGLGSGVNSNYDESAPIISADGQTLFFTRKGHPQNLGEKSLEDIWMSRLLPNGQWAKAVNLGPTINDRFANVPVWVGPNKNTFYFTSGQDHSLVRVTSTGRGWSFPENLTGRPFFQEGKIHAYSLSQDGKTLFFSWSAENGNPDLYLAFRQNDNTWSAPQPLGINSSGSEINPYFARDGRTLYFASNGLGGYGRMDLFLTRRLDESWQDWTEPENLGPDVNDDEDNTFISLTARGDVAYLVVKSDAGDLNIGELLLPKELQPSPVAVYEGDLRSAETGLLPAGAGLEIVTLKNPTAPAVRVPLSPEGTFRITVPRGEARGFFASAPGYLPADISLENTETESLPENYNASATFSAAYKDRDKRINLIQDQLSELERDEISYRRKAEAYLRNVKDKPVDPGDNLATPVVDSLLRAFQTLFMGARLNPGRDSLSAADSLKNTPEDPELLELRRQYQAYYHTRSEPEENGSDPDSWEGVRRFESILADTREELLKTLRPLIVQALQEEYWPQVRADTENKLDPASLTRLRENEPQIKERTRQDFVTLYPRVREPSEPAGMEPWEKELRQKLKVSLRRQVEDAVREALGEDIRNAMKERTLQALKELEKAAAQKEMDRLVLEQIKEEERQVDPWGADRETGITIKSGLPLIPADYEEIQTRILLVPVESGRSTILRNIFFNPNTAQLKDASYPELERLSRFLAENPDLVAEVGAHTNGYPSHAAAIQLSVQRAKRIYDYLLAQGISKNRLRYRGYGKTRPIASNDTLEGRRMNQRIELKILSTE